MAEVGYTLDDGTVVRFEYDKPEGFHPAGGADGIVGQVSEAIGPAVDAAQIVLDKVKGTKPDEVSVKFGIKVTGTMNWLIAKATTDANFEVTLTWKPEPDQAPASETAPGA